MSKKLIIQCIKFRDKLHSQKIGGKKKVLPCHTGVSSPGLGLFSWQVLHHWVSFLLLLDRPQSLFLAMR